MRNLLPGGYNFVNLAFWPVVALIAVGTQLVPILMTIGLVLLVLEAMGKV